MRKLTDDELRHHCRLGSIVVFQVQDPGFIRWLTEEADRGEQRNALTGLQIMAEAFVELARRQGMLPKFAVPAGREGRPRPSEAAPDA